MNLPDKCPFCWAGVLVMEDGKECRSGIWVTFDCFTMIGGIDKFQSRTCEDAERARLAARVAELEAREKQARDDEAWANGDGLVEFQPVTEGWVASTLDGVHGISATAPTIHGAIRALREKMGARP